jgi:nucleoside-diphosphate-sugar epimerase
MNSRRRALVTGASGFLGRALVPALQAAGWEVRGSGRDASRAPPGCEFIRLDLQANPDWDSLVRDTHAVVHLAARVHMMKDRARDPLAEFRAVNVSPTLSLAEAAARQNVRHFVYLSSIKVMGEATSLRPFSEQDAPAPVDAYGRSKLEAESQLNEVSARTGLGVTILRPPLIYGAEARGNFERLAKWIRRGWPLPVTWGNRRSFLFVGNFCSAVLLALEKPTGATRTYLLSDGEDLSTAELVMRLARSVELHPRLWTLPGAALRIAAALVGRSAEAQRLQDSLQVDSSRFRSELGWKPPYTVDEGLRLTLSGLTPSTTSRR